MSDRDFSIGSRKFKLNKLDTFGQFHLLRWASPILLDLVPMFSKIKDLTGKELATLPESEMQDIAKIFGPVIKSFAALPDADAEKIMLACLSGVEMQQEAGNWARLATKTQILFQNLDLSMLMNVAARSGGYNLKDFLAGPR